jgi:hypothetical protein
MIDTGLNTIRLMFLKLIHIQKLKLKHLCLLSELVFSMFSFIIDFCPQSIKYYRAKSHSYLNASTGFLVAAFHD